MELLLKKNGELHLSSQILRAMDIGEDQLLEVMLKNGQLILTPKKKRIRLDIYIQCFEKFSLRVNDQDQSFLINSKKTEELIAFLLCNEGEFVAKRKIAEQLWENLPEERAMDNFYKTYKRLNALPALGVPLSVEALRGKIRLDLSTIESDLQIFDRLYKEDDVAAWEQALNLYRGPLLRDEYYNWTTLPESHYDLCRTELFERIFAHYKKSKNNEKLSFYRRKWEDEL